MKQLLKNLLNKYFPKVLREIEILRFPFLPFYDRYAADELSTFLDSKELGDMSLIKAIKKDIYLCSIDYGTTAAEYFLFGFRGKQDDYRSAFLSDKYREGLLAERGDKNLALADLNNKFNFFKKNKVYFKRDVVLIPIGGGNFEELKKLSAKEHRLFIKPCGESCGRGASLINVESEEDLKRAYQNMVDSGNEWVVEEAIIQDDEMSKWNSSSVNTVRVPALLTKKGFFIMTPYFRTGRSGCVVDNAGSGGVFANIDYKSGKICTNGIDERGNTYKTHPDSGLTFIGWQIPKWGELMKLVEEIHRTTMSAHIYIGWDFALTSQGWCLIEGNWGQLVNQYADKVGRKEEFTRYMNYGSIQ